MRRVRKIEAPAHAWLLSTALDRCLADGMTDQQIWEMVEEKILYYRMLTSLGHRPKAKEVRKD